MRSEADEKGANHFISDIIKKSDENKQNEVLLRKNKRKLESATIGNNT